MRLRDEIRLAIGVVLALQVFTLLGAVGLLSRMTPAVEQILSENEYSMHAAEEMMVALLRDELPTVDRQRRFEDALRHAESNVTEPEEPAVLEVLQREHGIAITGDPDARRRVVDALTTLTAINRRSMHVADERARELGQAGAWAAVLLALVSFGGSLVLMRRLDRNVSEPLLEIRAALEAIQTGDSLRRCRIACDTHELREISATIDTLLSEHFQHVAQDWHSEAAADRALVIELLDRRDHPAWIVSASGGVRLANAAGFDRLLHDDSLAARLKSTALAGLPNPDEGETLGYERLRSGDWLVTEELRTRERAL